MGGRVGITLRALAACAAAAALGGCGLGPGPGTANVTMTVTRGFGSDQVGFATEVHVPGSETVMRMLERRFKDVQLRYGGGYVESIDGHSGNSSHTDWFYYVNGVEAPKGAANTALNRGDQVWWDLHDWSATDSIPAVVGSYPEPFVHGIAGKRLPTTVECGSDVAAACKLVEAALDRAGVPVASQYIGTGSGPDTLGVVVGTWKDISAEVAAERGALLIADDRDDAGAERATELDGGDPAATGGAEHDQHLVLREMSAVNQADPSRVVRNPESRRLLVAETGRHRERRRGRNQALLREGPVAFVERRHRHDAGAHRNSGPLADRRHHAGEHALGPALRSRGSVVIRG